MTPKQELFILEYLKDFNATQAAIRAGYSKKGAGQTALNLLKNPHIKQAIEEKKQSKFGAIEKEAMRVDIIERLHKIAFEHISDKPRTAEQLRAMDQLSTMLGFNQPTENRHVVIIKKEDEDF